MSSKTLLQPWEYRETKVGPAAPAPLPAKPTPPPPAPPPGITEAEVARRIAEAVREAEGRWSAIAEDREASRHQQVLATLQAFAVERASYFQQAETEVVHLALAIARKVLGREAALDPDLIHALVRIALDRMGAGPAVKLRVPAEDFARWQEQAVFAGSGYQCELVGDPMLVPGDCLVETDLGTASFGLDAQCKQIEQGMLDLLARRPPLPSRSRIHSPVSAEKHI